MKYSCAWNVREFSRIPLTREHFMHVNIIPKESEGGRGTIFKISRLPTLRFWKIRPCFKAEKLYFLKIHEHFMHTNCLWPKFAKFSCRENFMFYSKLVKRDLKWQMLRNHVFLFGSSWLFGGGNYDFHWYQMLFSNMLCGFELCLLYRDIEFGISGSHIELFNFLTPTLLYNVRFSLFVFKVRFVFQGLSTMVDFKVDWSLLTHVSIKVKCIFAPNSAPAHNCPPICNLSNCYVWLHLVPKIEMLEYHTQLLKLGMDPYILIHVVWYPSDHSANLATNVDPTFPRVKTWEIEDFYFISNDSIYTKYTTVSPERIAYFKWIRTTIFIYFFSVMVMTMEVKNASPLWVAEN